MLAIFPSFFLGKSVGLYDLEDVQYGLNATIAYVIIAICAKLLSSSVFFIPARTGKSKSIQTLLVKLTTERIKVQNFAF